MPTIRRTLLPLERRTRNLLKSDPHICAYVHHTALSLVGSLELNQYPFSPHLWSQHIDPVLPLVPVAALVDLLFAIGHTCQLLQSTAILLPLPSPP